MAAHQVIKLRRKERDPYALYRDLVREYPRADQLALLRKLLDEWPKFRTAAERRERKERRAKAGG